MWDSKSGLLQGSKGERRVEVEIDLPKGSISEADISSMLDKVFESSAEQKRRECTPDETRTSKPYLSIEPKEAKKDTTPQRTPQSQADLTSVCLPTGVRGYVVADGVVSPRAIYAPDPEYSEAARRKNISGTATYAVAVDENGLVSEALLIRSLEPTLNFKGAMAIREWRFQPAMFQGNSVPSAVHIDISFELR